MLVRGALGGHDAIRLAQGDAGCPKADHIRELLDRLGRVREIGLSPEIAERVEAKRLRQFVREGYTSDAHQLGRYTAHRRRAILVATAADLESHLTDAVLEMADKLIGSMFAKARNATRHRYVASAADIGRLMRLFHGTIEALAAAQGDAGRLRGRRRDGRMGKTAARAPGGRDLAGWPMRIRWCALPIAGRPCASSRPR